MPYTKEEKKAWYIKNRLKILEKQKAYVEDNKDKIKERKRAYSKTPNGKKFISINNWRYKGMITDDWEDVYNIYKITECCNYCKKTFKNNLDKHLDHNHETGEIRGVLCRSCNQRDVYSDSYYLHTLFFAGNYIVLI